MISIPTFHGEIPNFDCWKSLEPSQIPTFPLVLPHFSWCFTRFHSFNVHKPGISPWRVPPPWQPTEVPRRPPPAPGWSSSWKPPPAPRGARRAAANHPTWRWRRWFFYSNGMNGIIMINGISIGNGIINTDVPLMVNQNIILNGNH